MATTIQLPASYDLDDYTIQIVDSEKIIIRTCSGGAWSEQEHNLITGGSVRVFVQDGQFNIDTTAITGVPEEIKLRIFNNKRSWTKFLLTKINDVHTVELVGADDWRYICNLVNVSAREQHRFTLNRVSVKIERREIDGFDHLVLTYDPDDLGEIDNAGYISLREIG